MSFVGSSFSSAGTASLLFGRAKARPYVPSSARTYRHDTCSTSRMRPQRLPTFDYLGCHRYFVTCCTWKRQLLFDETSVPIVRQAAHSAFADRGFDLLAWVFMPDHVHWLLQGTHVTDDLRAAMTLARQRAAFAYRQHGGGRLWQAGFHDRVVRRTEKTDAIANYILDNPVRAGLVQDPHVYPFSWSMTLSDRA